MKQKIYSVQRTLMAEAKINLRPCLWIVRVFFACFFLLMVFSPFLRWSPAYALYSISSENHPYFYTGFERGDEQPTWKNTPATGMYPAGSISHVSGICCKLLGPELSVHKEWAYQGSAALLYSGYNKSSHDSSAYMKVFDTMNQRLMIDRDTELDYWIYPQGPRSNVAHAHGLASGSNSSCAAIDLIFSDGSNLRDSSMRDQYGNYIHPSWQCNRLRLDTWNYVHVDLGYLRGKQIIRIDVGHDQTGHIGGYRGYIDALTIRD